MKKVLSTIVSALVALAFAGLVSAKDIPPTETTAPAYAPPAEMKDDTGGDKTMKKAKKKKKAKKAKKHVKKPAADTGTTTPPATEPTPAPAAK